MNDNSLEKLMAMDTSMLLNDEENEMLSNLMKEANIKDWVYDREDNSMKLRVDLINKSTNPDPDYEKMGDSGFDLRAFIDSDITIHPNSRYVVPTGLYFAIPNGFELQVRPRSGLAAKNGITVLNTPGTVDSGYRGEVKVILYNTDNQEFVVSNGDRIAQGVICPVQNKSTIIFNSVSELSETDRGSGGFGSTGVK